MDINKNKRYTLNSKDWFDLEFIFLSKTFLKFLREFIFWKLILKSLEMILKIILESFRNCLENLN